MIRNIIFDWSGTLVDDLPAVHAAINQVFAQAGRAPMSLEEFRVEFSLPFQHFFQRFTPQMPPQQIAAWFQDHFPRVQDRVVALPQARSFLDFCRAQKLRAFLLSGIAPDDYAAQTAVTGFDRYFERVYLEVGDKRARIHSILKENQLVAAETLFVGDTQQDMEAARHGGIFSCAVLTGYQGLEQLRESEPNLVVEHLGELRDTLSRHGLELLPTGRGGAQGKHPIATVGGLIFNERGQVLMIQTRKWSNLWGIPGGKIKFGERSEEALRRELKEETDLEVEAIEFVLVQDCIHSQEFYRDAHFLLMNYACKVSGDPRVTLNEEAQRFCWVSLAEAGGLALNEPTRILLEAVASRLEERKK